MIIKVNSASFRGIDGVIVTIEVDISRGLPCFNIVGLGGTAIKESKERVRSAIINSGFEFPVSKITVNLAPADIKKEGSLFDLPIAIAILMATEQISFKDSDEYMFMGELSLSGELKKIKGALSIVIEGQKRGINKYIVPTENTAECCAIKSAKIFSFSSLKQVVDYTVNRDLMPSSYNTLKGNKIKSKIDFEDIYGQESAKRSLEVAAAGNHNVALWGPPGSGKTMLAKRIPTILPTMSYEEAVEVTKIYSISGNLPNGNSLITERPFRNPHHTASKISLIGGGLNLMPGEISLANNGVLFLDEILEFNKSVIEVLRQPIEDRVINISRANGSITYPASFMFLFSFNPCPCGFFGSKRECTCKEYERIRYINKLSGPLLDRIDLFTFVNSVEFSQISDKGSRENSETILKRVSDARIIQKNRYEKDDISCNSDMTDKHLNKYCALSSKASSILEKAFNSYNISTRAYSRILKVSRTLADLESRELINEYDIIEAINYRSFIDKKII